VKSAAEHVKFSLTTSIMTLLLMVPAATMYAADVKGSSDHPLFPNRMPGHSIGTYKTQEFSSYKFPGNPGTTVEGKYTRISYYRDADQPHPGGLAIRRNYENALRAAGGEVVYSRGSYVVMKADLEGGEVWAEVQASDNGRYYFLTIVEKTALAQVITADQIGTALDRDGFIALDIQFDFAKADIQPASRPTIAEITNLMKARPALRVGVEGHTDNVGAPDRNKALSLARANAVVAAITADGIDSGRLIAAGFGEERPIADNETEEGRAKNRRVELVQK
jgi:outer membrane protein OmpA-like peptidoglycan-associated protein